MIDTIAGLKEKLDESERRAAEAEKSFNLAMGAMILFVVAAIIMSIIHGGFFKWNL